MWKEQTFAGACVRVSTGRGGEGCHLQVIHMLLSRVESERDSLNDVLLPLKAAFQSLAIRAIPRSSPAAAPHHSFQPGSAPIAPPAQPQLRAARPLLTTLPYWNGCILAAVVQLRCTPQAALFLTPLQAHLPLLSRPRWVPQSHCALDFKYTHNLDKNVSLA